MTVAGPGDSSACSACGAALVPGDSFCTTCGLPAGDAAPAAQAAGSAVLACTACGATLEPDDSFCMTCGRPAGASGVASAASEPGSVVGAACAHCGATLVPGDAFCMACGGPADASRAAAAPVPPTASGATGSCAFCGTPLLADDAFCPGCGRAVSPAGQPPDLGQAAPHDITSVTATWGQMPAGPPVASGVEIDPGAPGTCPACGIELTEAERFCRGCGRLIKRSKG